MSSIALPRPFASCWRLLWVLKTSFLPPEGYTFQTTDAMAIGAVLEPLLIVTLLAGGTLVNRDTSRTLSLSSSTRPVSRRPGPWEDLEYALREDTSLVKDDDNEEKEWSTSLSSSELSEDDPKATLPSPWRRRTLRFWCWERSVMTPNTKLHQDRLLSRLLRQYPFLVEVWYWALIYWVRTTSTHTAPVPRRRVPKQSLLTLPRSTSLAVPSRLSLFRRPRSTPLANMRCR